jgi:hypothetical protein
MSAPWPRHSLWEQCVNMYLRPHTGGGPLLPWGTMVRKSILGVLTSQGEKAWVLWVGGGSLRRWLRSVGYPHSISKDRVSSSHFQRPGERCTARKSSQGQVGVISPSGVVTANSSVSALPKEVAVVRCCRDSATLEIRFPLGQESPLTYGRSSLVPGTPLCAAFQVGVQGSPPGSSS